MRRGQSAWIEIEVEQTGAGLRISARGSRNERPAPHLFSSTISLHGFTDGVLSAARRGRPLGARIAEAKEIYQALFREGAERLRACLAEASAGAPLLVRLMIHDPELQAVPWEAACDP